MLAAAGDDAVTDSVAPPEPAVEPAARASRDQLLARLQRVRADCERVRHELADGYATSTELHRRTAELRERRREAARRSRRRGAA